MAVRIRVAKAIPTAVRKQGYMLPRIYENVRVGNDGHITSPVN